MVPWEIFLKKYNDSPSGIRNLIDSEKIPTLSRKIVASGITNKKTRDLTIAISDFVLGLTDKTGLCVAVEINDSECETLVQQIESILGGQSDVPAIPEADTSLKERIEFRPEGTPPIDAQNETTMEAPKPLTRDELMRALAVKRTMAGDIEAVRRAQGTPPQSPNTPPPSAS